MMGMKTTLDDLYERESYMYGGGWISHENGVRIGDVRIINAILSKACSVEPRGWFRKDRVRWANVHPDEVRKVDINERPE
jgi:hypothetical protein